MGTVFRKNLLNKIGDSKHFWQNHLLYVINALRNYIFSCSFVSTLAYFYKLYRHICPIQILLNCMCTFLWHLVRLDKAGCRVNFQLIPRYIAPARYFYSFLFTPSSEKSWLYRIRFRFCTCVYIHIVFKPWNIFIDQEWHTGRRYYCFS